MQRQSLYAAALGLAMLAAPALGATMTFSRQAGKTVDDVSIDPSGASASNGLNTNLIDGDAWFGLVGYKTLLTDLPKVDGLGQQIVIDSATLTFKANGPISISIYRVTSDWLPLAAGSNQTNVSTAKRDVAGNQTWAAGNFGTADYDTGTVVTGPLGDYNVPTDFTVTGLVSAIYSANQNYGLAVIPATGVYLRSNEFEGGETPALSITYHYAPVPEPGALALLAVGAAGLVARRRR